VFGPRQRGFADFHLRLVSQVGRLDVRRLHADGPPRPAVAGRPGLLGRRRPVPGRAPPPDVPRPRLRPESARLGRIDMRAQAEVPSVRRSDTPRATDIACVPMSMGPTLAAPSKRLPSRRSSIFKASGSDPRCLVTRKFCQMLPLAESWAFGLTRPDAGRMRCPAETLGEGKGERTAGKGRQTATAEES
jgi:hypothetical protein